VFELVSQTDVATFVQFEFFKHATHLFVSSLQTGVTPEHLPLQGAVVPELVPPLAPPLLLALAPLVPPECVSLSPPKPPEFAAAVPPADSQLALASQSSARLPHPASSRISSEQRLLGVVFVMDMSG
jgi:hypothetical protein